MTGYYCSCGNHAWLYLDGQWVCRACFDDRLRQPGTRGAFDQLEGRAEVPSLLTRIKNLMKVAMLTGLFAVNAYAAGPWDGPHVQALAEQTTPVKRGFWHSARRISEVVLIGGHVADVHSSLTAPQGIHEANPLLAGSDGRFGRRGLILKSGIVGSIILAQRLANRSGRYDRIVAIVNFAQGGAAFGVAARNYRLEAK